MVIKAKTIAEGACHFVWYISGLTNPARDLKLPSVTLCGERKHKEDNLELGDSPEN